MKNLNCMAEMFPQDLNCKNIGVGIVLLSKDFKILHKNQCALDYLKLPRRGANFAKAVLDRKGREALKSLSEKKGSFCIIRFGQELFAGTGIFVRLFDGNIAVVLHTSMTVSAFLGAVLSSDVLRVIANCVVHMYEKKNGDGEILFGKMKLSVNSDYLGENHTVMRLRSLSDSAALLVEVLNELKLGFSTEISVSQSLMNPFKFIDIAILSYTVGELLATSRVYSNCNAVKLEIDVNGCAATVRVSGKVAVSSDISSGIFESGLVNLRLLLVFGGLASMGIRCIPNFKNDSFDILSIIPLAEKSFKSFRIPSMAYTRRFLVSNIINYTLGVKQEPRQVEIDISEENSDPAELE